MREIKLLVADDEQMVRTFVKSVIVKEKLPVAQVFETDNGTDAIRIAQQYHPELVLLDIRMPGCDGLRVAEQIIEENKKKTPGLSLFPRITILNMPEQRFGPV